MDKTPEEIEYERRWIEAEYETMAWPKLNPSPSNSDEPFFKPSEPPIPTI